MQPAEDHSFDVAMVPVGRFQMMKKTRWFPWLYRPLSSTAIARSLGASLTVAALVAVTGTAMAQMDAPGNNSTPVKQLSAPAGYSLHGSINMGGHMTNITGSTAMYDTLVNLHSGPRVLGNSLQLRPLKTNKHPLFDHLTIFGDGFGGDPFNSTRIDVEKGKYYQLTGTFNRDRQYFDYDLLANPDIPSGRSIPIGPTTAPTGSLAWPQVRQSPFLYNTVRRRTDVTLTLFPVSRVTYEIEYAQNVFEGPSLSPGGQLGQSDLLLNMYQRNSTDFFRGAIHWKPVRGTQFTFEELVDHYKQDSYYTIAPNQFTVQEADGRPAALGNWDSLVPYGINFCNTGSMGTAPYSILSDPQVPGGKPVINPACDVFTSYVRSQPTRILYPTEIFRFQSESIKNVQMNGDIRYTNANMNLPNYYENIQGLYGRVRDTTFTGYASAKRKVMAIDYALTWQLSPMWAFSEQLTYSNVQQPGSAYVSKGATLQTPGNPDETITYAGPLSAGPPNAGPHGSPAGSTLQNFFGQKHFVNNATLAWTGWSRATLSLTYRYRYHVIAQGIPHDAPLAVGSTTNGTVTIEQNGGILNVALQPTAHWNVNGSAAVFYGDNALTPIEPRQEQRYRVHTMFRPKPWLSVNAAYNDVEIHNNTNNNQAGAAAGDVTYVGPIDHVSQSRVLGLGAAITPNQYYSFDFNYGFSDVYTSTNICYDGGASATDPGAATASGKACPDATVRGAKYYEYGPTKDFMSAPTQYGTIALNMNPIRRLHSTLGYNISSVSGSRFYNEARDVAGSLISTYQSPFVKVSWAVHNGLVWDAKYNYYSYGEGGPSGAQYCSTSSTLPTPGNPAPVVSCDSPSLIGLQTGRMISPTGETAPRNFHANIVTLGMHYEF
jgi:hypothetical protein